MLMFVLEALQSNELIICLELKLQPRDVPLARGPPAGTPRTEATDHLPSDLEIQLRTHSMLAIL